MKNYALGGCVPSQNSLARGRIWNSTILCLFRGPPLVYTAANKVSGAYHFIAFYPNQPCKQATMPDQLKKKKQTYNYYFSFVF